MKESRFVKNSTSDEIDRRRFNRNSTTDDDWRTQGLQRSSNHGPSSDLMLTKTNSSRRPSLGGSERSIQSELSTIDMAYEADQDRTLEMIFDDPLTIAAYDSVPLLEIERLPRGGISFDTKSVGRIQYGIPPETIKDSMRLGLKVPNVYIVPGERFCREMGPALGINLCEFEFPAYFNYFVFSKQCALVVDSTEDEMNIKKVFSETLIGPAQFRNHAKPLANEEEDFDPKYPKERRPNYYKEFYHFRTAEASNNFQEFTVDTLIKFFHFSSKTAQISQPTKLGIPPPVNPHHLGLDGSMQGGVQYETDVEEMGHHAIDDSIDRSRGGGAGKQALTRTKSCPSFGNNVGDFREELARHSSLTSIIKENEMKKEKHAREEPKDSENKRRSFASDMYLEHKRSMRTIKVLQEKTAQARRLSEKEGAFWGSAGSMSGSDENDKKAFWTYSQAKWLGNVATIYPPTATEEDKESTSTPRVEIFKMPGGLEYIAHDIDENNHIIGKVRFSGTVHVPDSLVVNGFAFSTDPELLEHDEDECDEDDESDDENDNGQVNIPKAIAPPPSFDPPTFGVTVLGNSHGFDKSGSTSGYVLWINGRGVMVDPPPYASATLEREGIRPQMIMAIIVTHCHADHDAGTFQKVLTGNRIAVITTPTIYKSFIRKYSALSGLSPALLRHSHRFRPAIIGRPLLFQGATFDFHYTLHTIPCIAFHCDYRGKSLIITGDHMNIPSMIDKLEGQGVLAKERADDLRFLPYRECDVILHESGAPPIHTPLNVLLELPDYVKERLYVVHTSALPAGCPLRIAPVGTLGTIRIKIDSDSDSLSNNKYYLGGTYSTSKIPPLVSSRPTCVSDAWFILHLLSNIPFLSSLSYSATMEVLEVSQVKVFSPGDVVLQAEDRSNVLMVVWEGTLMERERVENNLIHNGENGFVDEYSISSDSFSSSDFRVNMDIPSVWYAGDWTGPIHLQPDPLYAGDATVRKCVSRNDIVAISSQGAKVIIVSMSYLQYFLINGSEIYRKYWSNCVNKNDENQMDSSNIYFNNTLLEEPIIRFSVLEIFGYNSCLRNMSAAQKRHLESLAEGPKHYPPSHLLWCASAPVTFAYIIISGSVKFANQARRTARTRRGSTGSLNVVGNGYNNSGNINNFAKDKKLTNVPQNSEYSKLEKSLQVRAEEIESGTFDNYVDLLPKEERHRNSRDRFANKVLARLYARKAYTTGLVFSRGHFLSDTTRMVSGSLAFIQDDGKKVEDHSVFIKDSHVHSSTMVAGRDGCVVYGFHRDSLIKFLDANPGVLLSLLGTQIVV